MTGANRRPPSGGGDGGPYVDTGAQLLAAPYGDSEVRASNERIRAMSAVGRLEAHMHLDADKMLTALGRLPPYQMFLATALGCIWIYEATQVMTMALVAEYHPYTCVHQNSSNASAPNSSLVFDMSCSAMGPDGAQHRCGGNETDYALVFDAGFGQTMVSEFHLVCSRRYMAHLLSTVFMAGNSAVSLLVTQLADVVGRKPVFLGSLWLGVALSIAVPTLLRSYAHVLVARCLLGGAAAGVCATGWVLQMETVAPHQRAFFATFSLDLLWSAGYMLVGLAAMYAADWRTLNLALILPFLSAAALHWLLPESLHWLIAQKRYGRAVEDITRLSKYNCATVDLAKCQKDAVATEAKPRRTLVDIVRSPALIVLGTINCYNCIVSLLVYYGLSLFSTRLSSDRFTGYFLSGLIEVPAGVTAILLLIWFGRKTVLIGSLALSLLGCLGLCFVNKGSPEWLVMTLYLVAKYGNTIVFPPNFMMQTEMFPTTVRNVAYGILGTLGTIGSMVAPFVGGLADDRPALPNAIYAALTAVSIALSLLLPETMNKRLPEDMDEVDAGPILGRLLKSVGLGGGDNGATVKKDIAENGDVVEKCTKI